MSRPHALRGCLVHAAASTSLRSSLVIGGKRVPVIPAIEATVLGGSSAAEPGRSAGAEDARPFLLPQAHPRLGACARKGRAATMPVDGGTCQVSNPDGPRWG